MNSSTAAPTIISRLRRNIEMPKPITCCNCVVSLDRRDTSSPERAVSKNEGDRVRMCENTARRRSVTMRSPVVIIR